MHLRAMIYQAVINHNHLIKQSEIFPFNHPLYGLNVHLGNLHLALKHKPLIIHLRNNALKQLKIWIVHDFLLNLICQAKIRLN